MGNNNEFWAYAIAGTVVVFLLSVLGLSQSIGAAFTVTLRAAFLSGLWLLIIGGTWLWLRYSIWTLAALLLVFLWPCWWQVLDSISAGGKSASEMQEYVFGEPLWYATATCKWSVELVACVLLGVGAWRSAKTY